jgi:K(+)-stimulated pyrophosphate-energized sodium pump
MAAIFSGFLTSAVISVISFGLVAFFYMRGVPGGWWRPFLSAAAGVGLAILIDRVTDYFTGSHGKPVAEIKDSAEGGPATIILSGLGVGYESAVWSVVVIAATIGAAILIYATMPVEAFVAAGTVVSAETARVAFVLYGVAMTGIGMLTLTGNNVAMDSFGPIADNANGIGEMAGLDAKARQIMADLDAVGNTTKAITKGIAIGSAVIAAVSLFGSLHYRRRQDRSRSAGLGHPRQPATGLHRPAHRRGAALALLLAGDQGGQPRRRANGRGGPPPVPHPRHPRRDKEARLHARRDHQYRRRAARPG